MKFVRVIWANPGERRKLFRFFVVGGSNFVVMYGVFLVVLNLGFHHDLALAADYGLGIVYNYVLNRFWTFRAQGKPTHGFVKLCASYGVMFLINLVLLEGFVHLAGLSSAIAQIPAVGLTAVASYFMQRFWVFKPRQAVSSWN